MDQIEEETNNEEETNIDSLESGTLPSNNPGLHSREELRDDRDNLPDDILSDDLLLELRAVWVQKDS